MTKPYISLILALTCVLAIGSHGASLRFTGSTFMSTNTGPGTHFNPDSKMFTIGAWVKLESGAPCSTGYIIHHTGTDKIDLYTSCGNPRFTLSVGNSVDCTFTAVSSVADIRDGTWHYISGSRNDMKAGWIIVDGDSKQVSKPEGKISSCTATRITTTTINIGKSFVGLIDDIRVFYVWADLDMVRILMEQTITGKIFGLFDAMNFDEGTGSTTSSLRGSSITIPAGVTWSTDTKLKANPVKLPNNRHIRQNTMAPQKGYTTIAPGSLVDVKTWTYEVMFNIIQLQSSYWSPLINYRDVGATKSTEMFQIAVNGLKYDSQIIAAVQYDGKLYCGHTAASATSSDYYRVSVGVWHHLAVTVDMYVADLHIYLDGLELSLGSGCLLSYLSPKSITAFGMADGTVSNSFRGMIDETRMWKTVRTLPQIQAGMGSVSTATTASHPDLVWHHSFMDDDPRTSRIDIPNKAYNDQWNMQAGDLFFYPEIIANDFDIFTGWSNPNHISGTLQPNRIAAGTKPTFELKGGYISRNPLRADLTTVAFSLDPKCTVNATHGLSGVIRIKKVSETAVSEFTLDSALTITGVYTLCFSEDDGLSYLATSYQITVIALDGQTSYITNLSPSSIGQNSDGLTMAISGLSSDYITPTTSIAWALPGKCDDTRKGTTILTTHTSVTIPPIAPYSNLYYTCFSLNGYDWTTETPRLKVYRGFTTRISAITPKIIGLGYRPTLTIIGMQATPKTYIAFATSGNCGTPNKYAKTLLAVQASTILLSAAIGVPNPSYKLCYTVNDQDWYEQTKVQIGVYGPTSPAQFTPNTFGTGTQPTITFDIGFVPTPTSYFAFSTLTSCVSTNFIGAITPVFTSGPKQFTDAISVSRGTYYLCMSTDNGVTWGRPSPATDLTVVESSTDAPTAFSPTLANAGASTTISFTGGVVTTNSKIALTLSGCSGTLNAVDFAASVEVLIGSTVGNYQICYSANGGLNWAAVPGILNVYAGAQSNVLSAVTPSQVAVDTTLSINVTVMNDIGPNAKLAFALTGGCTIVSLRTSEVPLTTLPVTVTMPSQAGTYSLCFSSDNGVTFVGQTHGSLTVIAASSSIVSEVIPNFLQVNETGVQMTLVGAQYSPTTQVAFVLGIDCSTARIGTTNLATGNKITFTESVSKAGNYRVCYAVNGVWFVQANPLLSIVQDSKHSMVTAVSETNILLNSQPSITVMTTSSTTFPLWVGFVLAGTKCNVQIPQAITLFTKADEVVPLGNATTTCTNCTQAGFTVAGSYVVCAATSSTGQYYAQSASAITVTTVRITSVEPKQIVVGTTPVIKYVGLTVIDGTMTAFSQNCLGGTRYGVTVFSQGDPDSKVLGGAILSGGEYNLCYSSDYGTKWRQMTATLTVLEASSTSITSILPTTIGLWTQPTFNITGSVGVTENSKVGLALSPSGCGSPNFIGTILTPSKISFGHVITAGNFTVCYTVDGTTWHAQGVSITVRTIEDTTVTDVLPSIFGAQTMPSITMQGLPSVPTTYVGFSRDGCSTVLCRTPSPGTNAVLSSPLPVSGTNESTVTYNLCVALNGTSYIKQTAASIVVVSATSTLITTISPSKIGVNSQVPISLTGAIGLPTAKFGFAIPGGQCSYGVTDYPTAVPTLLGKKIDLENTFKACFSVDAGAHWTTQTLAQLDVIAATPYSISSISPTVIAGGSIRNITCNGLALTPTTTVVIAETGNCSNALSTIDFSGSVTGVMSSSITVPGIYEICLTVDGVKWVAQKPQISVIVGSTTNIGNFTPTAIAAYTQPYFQLADNGVTTPTASFAFSDSGKCSIASERVGETSYPIASVPMRLESPINATGQKRLCFSVDSITFYEQVNAGYLNISILSSSSIESFTPRVIGAQTSQDFEFYAGGFLLPATPFSKIAFAIAGTYCGVLESITDYYKTAPAKIQAPPCGTYKVCFSQDGVSYIEQIAGSLLVVEATNSTITAVVPPAIERGSSGPISLVGATATLTTKVAFALPGKCATNRFAVTSMKSSVNNIVLSDPLSIAATYDICLSTGPMWVKQDAAQLIVEDCIGLTTCPACTAADHCSWCLNTNMCTNKHQQVCLGTNTTTACPSMNSIGINKSPTQGGVEIDIIGSAFVDSPELKCQFSANLPASGLTLVNVTYSSPTKISCVSPLADGFIQGAETSRTIYTELSLVLNGANYAWKPSSVTLPSRHLFSYYNCSTSTSCVTCYDANAPLCGWCMNSAMCTISKLCQLPSKWGGNACPLITSVSPREADPLGGALITIKGSLFIDSPNLKCNFGGTTAATKYKSPQEVTCVAPSGKKDGNVNLNLLYNGDVYTKNSVPFLFITITDVLIPSIAGGAGALACLGAAAFFYIAARRKKQRLFSPPKLTRETLAGILFKPPKVNKTLLPMARYLTELEELLFSDRARPLLFAISDSTQATEMDMATRSLVHLSYGRQCTLQMLKDFITHEVAVSTSQSTLFRTNSFATKLFNVYSKMLGIPFLHEALGYVLNESLVNAGDVEMDTYKRNQHEDDEEDAETMARFKLLLVNQKVLRSIVKSEAFVPAQFRDLFKHLQTSIREKYPIRSNELAQLVYGSLMEDLLKTSKSFDMTKDKYKELTDLEGQLQQDLNVLRTQIEPILKQFQSLDVNVRDLSSQLGSVISAVDDLQGALDPESHAARRLMEEAKRQQNSIAIGGFFFLRFLVPAVTTPESYGIVSDIPNIEQRRMLVLVAKVLQNLSNNVEFGQKEEYMIKLNDFLRTNHRSVNTLFDRLSDTSLVSKPLKCPKVAVPPHQHDAAIVSIFEHIRVNMTKIMDELVPTADMPPEEAQARANLAEELTGVMQICQRKAITFGVGQAIRSGWLTKVSSGKLTRNHERWFVLKGASIQYYKNEEDKVPVGAISMEEVITVVAGTTDFNLALVTKEKKINIQAKTKQDRDAWLDAISKQVNAIKARKEEEEILYARWKKPESQSAQSHRIARPLPVAPIKRRPTAIHGDMAATPIVPQRPTRIAPPHRKPALPSSPLPPAPIPIPPPIEHQSIELQEIQLPPPAATFDEDDMDEDEVKFKEEWQAEWAAIELKKAVEDLEEWADVYGEDENHYGDVE